MASRFTARAPLLLTASMVSFAFAGCDESTHEVAAAAEQLACPDGSVCPSGALCGGQYPASEQPSGCQLAAGIDASVYMGCHLNLSDSIPTTLLGGFGVSRLPSSVQRGASATTIVWEHDDDARFVACALFGCAPEFTDLGGATRISNYDSCVLADAVVPSADAQISVSALVPRMVQKDGACDSHYPGCTGYVAQQLSLGCWMYDSHSLVSATDLFPLTPADAPQAHSLFAAACDDPANSGESCVLGDKGRAGTCFDHACRARCLTVFDCASAPSTTTSQTTLDAAAGTSGSEAPACSQRCVLVDSLGLGVCETNTGAAN